MSFLLQNFSNQLIYWKILEQNSDNNMLSQESDLAFHHNYFYNIINDDRRSINHEALWKIFIVLNSFSYSFN